MKHTKLHFVFSVVALGFVLLGVLVSSINFTGGISTILVGVALYLNVLWSGYGRD